VKTRNAEEHISDIDADKNKRRTAFIKFASSAVLLCLIIFVYTFAWFTMNKNADVTGGNMKSASLPFELKTEGTEGFLDSCLDSSYKRLGADSGVLTTADGQSIQWLVTKENNANNYKDSETNEDDTGIHPGSHGTLRFWIVPKEQQTIKVNYNLKITPYKNSILLIRTEKLIMTQSLRPSHLARAIKIWRTTLTATYFFSDIMMVNIIPT